MVPNNWQARRGFELGRYGQFQSGRKLYREQLFKEFLESDETDFFAWARRREFTTHELRRAPQEARGGSVAMAQQWLPRASTGDATYLVAGDERDDVRRSERRRAPAPAPAPAPMSSDDELDVKEERPKWAERSRSARALAAIFRAKRELISGFAGTPREIAERLCEPDRSTAEADVDLYDRAFQWGDAQWAQWHLDNDSDEEMDEEEEEEDNDPFSEANMPRATKSNRAALRALFKQRFGFDAPPSGNSQSKLFGNFLEYLRHCIKRNVYP